MRSVLRVVSLILAVTALASFGAVGADEVRLTILFDNYVHHPDAEASWGFSCLVEGYEQTILFDVGADAEILAANSQLLGVDPSEIDAVVLSHHHSDHIDGMPVLLDLQQEITVFIPRLFRNDARRQITTAWTEVVEARQPTRICDGVHSTGSLADTEGTFYEQALVLETAEGIVVVTGCAHPGVVRIATRASTLFPDEPILLLLGGFHTFDSAAVTALIAGQLQTAGVLRVAPTHCTQGREGFALVYGEDYNEAGVGAVFTFDR